MSNTNYLITRVFKDIYNYESIPDNAECKKKYTKLYNEINSKKEDEPETLEDLESAFSFPRMALRDFRERKARFLEKSLEDFSSNKNEIEELNKELADLENPDDIETPISHILTFIIFLIIVTGIYIVVESWSGIFFWMLDKIFFIICIACFMQLLFDIYNFFAYSNKTKSEVIKARITSSQEKNHDIQDKVSGKFPLFKEIINFQKSL